MAQRLSPPLRPAGWWPPEPRIPRPSLGDAVHVWAAGLDPSPAELESLYGLLTPEESDRAGRFHFERDRRRFAAARGLLRILLGSYLGREPRAIPLTYGPRGKPRLPTDAGGALCFNVSHSGGRVLLAFALGREVGVDLERERRVPELEQIAERFFSRREHRALLELPTADRPAAFFRCWTRKEAFLKATGEGLGRPLETFDVTLAPGQPARLLRVEGEPEEVDRWWLEDLAAEEGLHATLAVEGRPSRVDCLVWPELEDGNHGKRRARGHDDLQGGAQPRGAVLDLAR